MPNIGPLICKHGEDIKTHRCLKCELEEMEDRLARWYDAAKDCLGINHPEYLKEHVNILRAESEVKDKTIESQRTVIEELTRAGDLMYNTGMYQADARVEWEKALRAAKEKGDG